MLNQLIKKVIFRATFSLAHPTYVLPEEVHWLDRHFKKDPRFTDKFSYLRSLESLNQLPSFYENKTFESLSEAEIFFLMNSKIPYNLSRKHQQNFVAKVESTYFKCLLYKEFALLGKVEQMIIILSFNEQLFQMKPFEIAFCLRVISDFEFTNQIDVESLQKVLKQYAGTNHYPREMLVINGYLADMNVLLKDVLTPDNLKSWVQHNSALALSQIYFIYRLHEVLGLALDPALKSKIDENMNKSIEGSQLRQFQANFLVFLVKYYPQQTHKLSQLHFTPRAYLNYLSFYNNNKEHQIGQHPIPAAVIRHSSYLIFKNIFQLRLLLKLDSAASIARNVFSYFTYELQPIKIFVKYLMENKIRQPQIEYYLEKAFLSKLQMQEFDPKILEEYAIHDVINILSSFVHMKYCSVNFWRIAVRWIEQFIEYQKQNPELSLPYKSAYRNLLHLALKKNFKEDTRKYLIEEIASTLEQKDEHFYISQLKRLVSTLTGGRVGEAKIWLLIQYRLLNLISANMSAEDQKSLYSLTSSFNSMNKGSPTLWSTINKNLSINYKRELLGKPRSPMSLVSLYITAPSDE